jgi:biotin carboxylase
VKVFAVLLLKNLVYLLLLIVLLILESFRAACDDIGYPNFVKPVMSSSGKGQSRVKV